MQRYCEECTGANGAHYPHCSRHVGSRDPMDVARAPDGAHAIRPCDVIRPARRPEDECAKQLVLPTDAARRKAIPIVRGCLDYFPAALAAVAELSRVGNDKHNPGQPMHHARSKSSDHADCIVRHLIDRGTIDPEDASGTRSRWRGARSRCSKRSWRTRGSRRRPGRLGGGELRCSLKS